MLILTDLKHYSALALASLVFYLFIVGTDNHCIYQEKFITHIVRYLKKFQLRLLSNAKEK